MGSARQLALGPNQLLTVLSQGRDELVIDSHWRAGADEPPPAHYHPEQHEHFEILEGEMEVTLDGETSTVRAGDTLEVPAGVVHQMRPLTETRARWQVRPALRTLEFFEVIAELSGGGSARGVDPLEKFQREFRLA